MLTQGEWHALCPLVQVLSRALEYHKSRALVLGFLMSELQQIAKVEQDQVCMVLVVAKEVDHR